MPKLRRLNGRDVIVIFETFGFTVIRISGSHHRLRRTIEGRNQYLTVAVHGGKPLPPGTLKSLYRQASKYISEEDLKPHFYSA